MRKYNPTSPGRRDSEVIDYASFLTRKEPEKSLTFGFRRRRGRNSYGRITTRHKGGGAKRLYREVDFKYDKIDVPGRVMAIEYDPNRTSFLALIFYKDGAKRYILSPADLKIGNEVITSEKAPIAPGNRLILKNIPIGTTIYNIELEKGKGAQFVRSAGSGALVVAQKTGFTHIQLPSKELRMIPFGNWASIGSLSNADHKFMTWGKAGRMRHRGIRPTVRGTAMNPRDHPHGGGEGRTQRGLSSPKTPWGKLARGVKTRKRFKRSDKFILSRRKR